MKKIEFSNSRLEKDTQAFFLKSAGFVIKLTFKSTERLFLKRKLIEDILEIWVDGGFIELSAETFDFEIVFCSKDMGVELIQKNGGKKDYYLAFERDFAKSRVYTSYHISFAQLQIIIKEILSFLMRSDGFIIHGSACLNREGKLHIFLAKTGGGKTTIANLVSKSRKYVKFCDDSLLVREIADKWYYFSPPYIEKGVLPRRMKVDNARIYFIKKGKIPSKKIFSNKDDILKLILEQLWLRFVEVDKQTLRLAMEFVKDNQFYLFTTTLNREGMIKIINEN